MKHYVVLKGHTTWIFTNRDECKRQVDGFLWSQYKSFATEQAAQFAWKEQSFWHKWQFTGDYLRQIMRDDFEKAICTDAACPSNPGPVEYRWVIIDSCQEIFNYGPYQWGSVNIAEFLAIVAWIQRLSQQDKYSIIYTDSSIALWWIQKKDINTTIKTDKTNITLFNKIGESISRLNNNPERQQHITLKKRPTSQRGQIPADFWRK